MNIQMLFNETQSVHNYNTRCSSKGNFDVKFCRTKVKSMTISIIGVKLWNDLDKHIREVDTIVRFTKNNLKKVY